MIETLMRLSLSSNDSIRFYPFVKQGTPKFRGFLIFWRAHKNRFRFPNPYYLKIEVLGCLYHSDMSGPVFPAEAPVQPEVTLISPD